MATFTEVVIVGAGFAGLGAASILCSHPNFHVTVLEGASRVGGRSLTVENNGYKVELGSTFIHGSRDNALYDKATELKIINVPGTPKGIVHLLSSGEKIADEVVDRYTSLFNDVLDETIKCARTNNWREKPDCHCPISAYLTAQFNEAAGEDASEMKQPVLEYCLLDEGFSNGTKLSEGVGLLTCGDYGIPKGDDDSNIVVSGGYSEITDSLAASLPSDCIHLNSEVATIAWNRGDNSSNTRAGSTLPVEVTCTDGRRYEAHHVIVTVSLGVLKQGSLQGGRLFDPQLPERKLSAIAKVGMGLVDKVAIKFATPLVEADHQALFLYWLEKDKGDPRITQPWARCQSTFDHISDSTIYTAWFCSHDAHTMENLTDDEIVSGIVSTLELFLRRPLPGATLVGRSAWGGDRHFLGSYSYNPPGASKEDRVVLSEPVDGTTPMQLLFAGEATHPSRFSTTHGAFESGQREGRRLLLSLCT